MQRSVVLRGSLFFPKRPGHYTQNVIDSIRSWHNGELIVSTWHDQIEQARSLYGIDKLVVSPDPGDGPLQQMQRQLNSYRAGVSAATGEQILVTRTDIVHFRNLFEFIGKDLERSTVNFGSFRQKLVIGNIMTIAPGSSEKINTFRACDWYQCGWAEDIHRWCSIHEELAAIPKQVLDAAWSREDICTEKLWFSLVLQKYARKDFDWQNTSQYDAFAWHALVDNFTVLDSISTARTLNLNWAFQPQRLACYVTEKQFNHVRADLCGVQYS